jgi:hypothetical protein
LEEEMAKDSTLDVSASRESTTNGSTGFWDEWPNWPHWPEYPKPYACPTTVYVDTTPISVYLGDIHCLLVQIPPTPTIELDDSAVGIHVLSGNPRVLKMSRATAKALMAAIMEKI